MSDLQTPEEERPVDPESLQAEHAIELVSNTIHRAKARPPGQGSVPFLSGWFKFTHDDDSPNVNNALPVRLYTPPLEGNFLHQELFSKLKQMPLKPALVISGQTIPSPGTTQTAGRFYSFIPDLTDPKLQQILNPEDLAEGAELLRMFSEIATGGSDTVRDVPVAIDNAASRANNVSEGQIEVKIIAFQQKIIDLWLTKSENVQEEASEQALSADINLNELSAELAFLRNDDPKLEPFLKSEAITGESLSDYLRNRDPLVNSEEELQLKLIDLVSGLVNATPETLSLIALMSPGRRADLLATTNWDERNHELTRVARDLLPVFANRQSFKYCLEQVALVLKQDQTQSDEVGSANLSSFLSQLERSTDSKDWTLDALTYVCNLPVGDVLALSMIDPLHRFQLLRIPMETTRYTKARAFGQDGIKRRLAEKWTSMGRPDIANLLDWDPYSQKSQSASAEIKTERR